MKMIVLSIFVFCSSHSIAQNNADAILGQWISENKNCIVEVFKQADEFKAKVAWFNDKGKKPMNEWLDEKNPDKSLRSRKLIGMEVLNKLHYNTEDNVWEDGVIYDASSGKKWDSVVWLTKDNLLKVKGYWLFRFMSETRTFKKVNDNSHI